MAGGGSSNKWQKEQGEGGAGGVWMMKQRGVGGVGGYIGAKVDRGYGGGSAVGG